MLIRLALAGALVFFAAVARSETLVVAAPFTEFPALAAQMLDGATAAMNGRWAVKPIDAGCSETSAATIGDIIMAEKPDAAIGLPCIESLMPVISVLGPARVPLITVASRAGAPSKLAIKNDWPLYRIGPREREESEAIAGLIVEAWRDKPFAILDDGTIFARDTAEAIRNAAETSGIKPVLIEGFQPQLESQKKLIDRLVTANVSHVFIASDRANIAQIAVEATPFNLVIAGPETLRANDLDFPLPAGVLMAARDLILNSTAIGKIQSARITPFAFAEGYTIDTFIAAEIAIQLKTDSTRRSFDTAAGPMVLSEDGFIEPVKYALFRFDGFGFEKVAP